MTPFAIAGLQLELSAAGENLGRMEKRLDYLMHLYPWVQMAMFSELAACGPSPRRAEPIPGPAERTFQAMALKHGIWLVSGSHFEIRDGRICNTLSVIAPDGRVRARYRKMFPFLPYEAGVAAGDEFVVFDIEGVGRFGVSICYDMWFPETSRTLAALGAEVLLHPSFTNTIDRDVEVAMARATAAQNQMYVIDINGAGEVGNGRSVFVGPAGDVIHEAGTVEELIPIEIDLDRVRRERETGLRGLGQPLKSFRDARITFPVYAGDARSRAYLGTLGELRIPGRGSRAGLPRGEAAAPAAGEPVKTEQPETAVPTEPVSRPRKASRTKQKARTPEAKTEHSQ